MNFDLLLTDGFAYVLAGSFAGLVAGLMGVGGGIVVVPTLFFLFHENQTISQDLIMPVAIGTSLAVMIFTSQASVRAHCRQGRVLWSVYKLLIPGIVLGTVFGALLAEKLPTQWLKILFASFLIFVALRMVFALWQKKIHAHGFPRYWLSQLISFCIGTMSGLLGMGGGLVTIPFLNYCGLDMKKLLLFQPYAP